MKTHTITQLAKEFGLSRSTLLYYDSIGLLTPTERTAAGYRLYSDNMVARLQKICDYREAGVPLKEIAGLLKTDQNAPQLLRKRLDEVNATIRQLRLQQQLIITMLSGGHSVSGKALCDRKILTEALRSAGLSEETMRTFHRQFERNAPDAHHDFLSILGFSQEEIVTLRQFCRDEDEP